MPLDIARQTLETERVVDSRVVKALIETDACLLYTSRCV